MMRALRIAAFAAAVLLCQSVFAVQGAYDWKLPAGVAPPPVPSGNPMSAAKVALGRRLFYDADLSVDGTISCGTCHEQHRAFTEGNRTHGGVRGAQGRRNVMALINVAYLNPLTWANPALTSLERQVLIPVLGEHPVEMGMTGQEQELTRRLEADSCYRQMFAAAFPGQKEKISLDTVAKSIAAFERTLLSFNSPYDRYSRGDRNAIDETAKRGETLFFGDRFQCASCHSGANFTDLQFHKAATSGVAIADAHFVHDDGLSEETHDAGDAGKFRTPGLRNIALTGPYLHDGSAKELSEAIQRHEGLSGAGADDLADLIAFLKSLTDTAFTANRDFALPKTACGKKL